MTRIALVRHGETDWNRVHRIQGRSDIPLNDAGREQARRTAFALRGQAWDAVYASPLSRALETATIIAEELGLEPPTPVESLTERNYGAAEGLTSRELDAAFPPGSHVPGRESREEAAARAIPALAELGRMHARGSILVVSHGGLIRSVLIGIEPELGLHHTEPIANGSVHSVELVGEALTLVAFNEELVVPGDHDEDITAQNAVEEREAQNSGAAKPSR